MNIEVIQIELTFYPLPGFKEEAIEIWGEEEFANKLQEIADNLYRGDHLGANLWKVRIGAKGKGKSGGARVIYLQLNEDRSVFLIEAYDKSEKEDLSPEEEKELVDFVNSLDLGAIKDEQQEQSRKIKAQIKDRGGFQQRQAGAGVPQGKNKSARRKKDKRKR